MENLKDINKSKRKNIKEEPGNKPGTQLLGPFFFSYHVNKEC
jgi:hypothetical protein